MNVPNHPNQDQILLENVLSALGSPLRLTVLKVSEPPKRKAGQKVGSVAELVSKLRTEAKVI